MRPSPLLAVLISFALPLAATAQPKKAVGHIELADPAGDVTPITTSEHASGSSGASYDHITSGSS